MIESRRERGGRGLAVIEGRRGRAGRGLLLVGVLLGIPGCGVDLLVGPPAAGTDDGGSTGEPGTTTTIPEPATDGTTTSDDDGTSTGHEVGTTTEHGEGTTSEGATGPGEEGTTAADIPCPGLGFADCNDLGYCLWYGPAEMGECALSPCEDPEHDCWGLPMGDCEGVLACAWTGDPELGECAPIECVSCEILGMEQCVETPTCEWLVGKEICAA